MLFVLYFPLFALIVTIFELLLRCLNCLKICPSIQMRLSCTPQDNFSWVPNCSLGSPECETKLSSKTFWYGLY